MSKLIITEMNIEGVPCIVCALEEERKIIELQIEQKGKKTVLNNIYVGKIENVASNIQAAFVRFGEAQNGYLPLAESEHILFSCDRRGKGTLRPGDEVLVQVSRDAMKGKLPALSANLNFTGKYLVLTTGEKKFGLSHKLSKDERMRLSKWLEEEIQRPDKEYGLIVRTNASEALKEEILHELEYLKKLYEKTAIQGKNRTCYSLLYQHPPVYMSMVRDLYTKDLEEIVTDLPEILQNIEAYYEEFDTQRKETLRLYQDPLLPLYKLYNIEGAIEEISHEKIWLKSGGFLVIQQTEAFVSIDVNSGKFTGKKKAEETYRKINLEAAEEIARQLRLRNLSGIILIDFINMENLDHQDELFHVLQKYLRKDSVKSKVVDITPLHILEMTRKKVRRPVIEDLKELK